MSPVITIRLEDKDAELLRNVCKARSEGISSFVRRAILKELALLCYLPEDRKKALGFTQESQEEPSFSGR